MISNFNAERVQLLKEIKRLETLKTNTIAVIAGHEKRLAVIAEVERAQEEASSEVNPVLAEFMDCQQAPPVECTAEGYRTTIEQFDERLKAPGLSVSDRMALLRRRAAVLDWAAKHHPGVVWPVFDAETLEYVQECEKPCCCCEVSDTKCSDNIALLDFLRLINTNTVETNRLLALILEKNWMACLLLEKEK